MRSQVSVEMLIILGALIAVAVVLVSQFWRTAKEAKYRISRDTNSVMWWIDKTRNLRK